MTTVPASPLGQPLSSSSADSSQGALGEPNLRADLMVSTKTREREKSTTDSRLTPSCGVAGRGKSAAGMETTLSAAAVCAAKPTAAVARRSKVVIRREKTAELMVSPDVISGDRESGC